ncbi:MAG: sterol desaturase family protein [Candidatus Brocadiae bacterium]|nr:sterol desaturase family protein [Candidatus Brocadiia bacterium]
MAGRPATGWKFAAPAILAVAGVLAWISLDPQFEGSRLAATVRRMFAEPLRARVTDHLFAKSFLAVMSLTLALEWLIPARPRQRWWSVGAVQDLGWFFYEGVLHASIVLTWVALLAHGRDRWLPDLPLPPFAGLPTGWKIALGLLATDLCMWIQHWLHHRIPWLWKLHAVHHAQTELNFFTDFRYHVLEYVVRHTLLAVPLILLRVEIPHILALSVFLRWYTRFYHANIRTDLGALRYLLVTPQSHRIHHSIEERHHDRNLGSIFSIWDFLFRTQYRGWSEYPESGIRDADFPLETSRSPLEVLVTPVRQMAYPLACIGRAILAGLRRSRPGQSLP